MTDDDAASLEADPNGAARAGALLALARAPALAQEFEKVENAPREEIPAGRSSRSPTASSGWRSSFYVVIVARGLARVEPARSPT